MDENPIDLKYSPIQDSDGPEIIDIFNYYILYSDAAFPEEPVPTGFFAMLQAITSRYPSVSVRDGSGTLIGFGMVKPHNPFPAFSHTAEISYFIRPEWTGKGIGRRMLEYLTQEGKEMGLSCILAEISSGNEASIRFHHREGFSECGRFRDVGRKNGILFDTVWMQKKI